MTSKKQPTATSIDELDSEQIAQRFEETMQHLDAVQGLWPDLRRKSEAERRRSLGRLLPHFAAPLRALFAALVARPGEPRPPIAAAFDLLGAQDHGQDPAQFEAELLARRLDRAEAEQKVADRLADMERHFSDDVLDTGDLAIGPGLLALELARTVAKANPQFQSILAPVLDGFRELTKSARRRLGEQRAAKNGAAAPAAEPAPGGKTPATP